MTKAKFQIFQSKRNRQWYFRLRGVNGLIIAQHYGQGQIIDMMDVLSNVGEVAADMVAVAPDRDYRRTLLKEFGKAVADGVRQKRTDGTYPQMTVVQPS